MEYTTNFNLSKPSYDDDVDVAQLNRNMDILDDSISKYLPLLGGTMLGDIIMSNGTKLKNENSFIKFNTTETKSAIETQSDTLKCATGNKEFILNSEGAWYDGHEIARIIEYDSGVHGGYIRLSNGFTIQWGYQLHSDHVTWSRRCNFTIPMTTDTYSVFIARTNGIGNPPNTSADQSYEVSYKQTTTGFEISCGAKEFSERSVWLAIGK